MISYLQKTHDFLSRLTPIKLIPLFVTCNVINAYLFSVLAKHLTGDHLKNPIDDTGGMSQFLMVVFAAPIIESLIFQYAIIESIGKKIAPLYVCFCSAIAFALIHLYSPYYFLYTLVSGFIFAYLYLIGKSALKGFLLVLTAHVLYNLLIYVGRSF